MALCHLSIGTNRWQPCVVLRFIYLPSNLIGAFWSWAVVWVANHPRLLAIPVCRCSSILSNAVWVLGCVVSSHAWLHLFPIHNFRKVRLLALLLCGDCGGRCECWEFQTPSGQVFLWGYLSYRYLILLHQHHYHYWQTTCCNGACGSNDHFDQTVLSSSHLFADAVQFVFYFFKSLF